MKRSFYPRLAIDGMRKNRRMYGPYLAMGVLMAAICYILSALSRSDALRTLPGGDNLCMIMALGNVVLLIFSVIFLFYTNSFLIRRRRREFGLYNVLGMSKRNLARILTWETLLTAAIAIAGGPEGGEPALTAPCGVCRQVMREFCDPEEFRIILGAGTGEKQVYLLKELLPLSFGPDNLKGKE